MASPTPLVYLVTGANRGIGLALVQQILTQPNVLVFATARDPSNALVLQQLKEKYPGKVEILKYVATAGDEESGSGREVAKRIEERCGYVDVVVANAAVGSYLGPISSIPLEAFRLHLDVNVTAVLTLFQATLALLQATHTHHGRHPKFIPVTSAVGSMTAFVDTKVELTTYGTSKVALNYLARRIHFEHEWLVCFPLAPGVVDTDMSRFYRDTDTTGILAAVGDIGMEGDKAAQLLVGIIDSSTRETHGGEFINVDGSKLSW